MSVIVDFIPLSPGLLKAMRFEESFQRETGATATSEQLAHLRQLVRQSLDFYESIGASDPWTGYLVRSAADSTVVGCCGFKGNPAEKAVEISYHTLPEFEGRGFATAAAAKMVDVAGASGQVEMVLAHTLTERNASGRLLEKIGFAFRGEVIDPDDGLVWRWEKPVCEITE